MVNKNDQLDYIKKNMLVWGLQPSDLQCEQLYNYYEMLVEQNKNMNLTAITDFEDVVCKHFIDSVAISQLDLLHTNMRLIDIGTGAGFPGIPLKIMFPDLAVTLLDSLQKRIDFLNDVILELKLENIEAVHGRAEEFLTTSHCREYYDICVSRAVANLSVLSEFCLPYVKMGGFFIPYKSASSQDEIQNAENGINTLGGRIEKIVDFTLPQSDIVRKLVIINKIMNTPEKYPRRFSKISKHPL